jgi:Uma2 family endonuclease
MTRDPGWRRWGEIGGRVSIVFQPVAMTGGSPNADAIGGKLITALNVRLSGTKWQPYGPNAGVETASNAVCFPDALVTCTEFDGESPTVPGAFVVFEIVGKTRESINRDHVEKVAEYATVPSILRYVIVESQKVLLTIRERAGGSDPWKTPALLKNLQDVPPARIRHRNSRCRIAQRYQVLRPDNYLGLRAAGEPMVDAAPAVVPCFRDGILANSRRNSGCRPTGSWRPPKARSRPSPP